MGDRPHGCGVYIYNSIYVSNKYQIDHREKQDFTVRSNIPARDLLRDNKSTLKELGLAPSSALVLSPN
jgi:hypothetical protein